MLDVYKTLKESVIRKYCKEILKGLEYLHSHNIIHRDIKGANILVDKIGSCKLTDFGGSKVISEEIKFNNKLSFKGTPNWMAPETVKKCEYSRYSDIWSLGCTLIEMVTGQPPWNGDNSMNVLYKILKTDQPPEFPVGISKTFKHFLSCCLKMNPKERWNVTRLLNHPFINEVVPSKQINSSAFNSNTSGNQSGKTCSPMTNQNSNSQKKQFNFSDVEQDSKRQTVKNNRQKSPRTKSVKASGNDKKALKMEENYYSTPLT